MAMPLRKKLRALAPNFVPILDDTCRLLSSVTELYMSTLLLGLDPSFSLGGDGKRGWRSVTTPRVREASRAMSMMRDARFKIQGQSTREVDGSMQAKAI